MLENSLTATFTKGSRAKLFTRKTSMGTGRACGKCGSHAYLQIFLLSLLELALFSRLSRAVTRRDIGGGGVVCIHIFMFTYCRNNRFQKKSVKHKTNI